MDLPLLLHHTVCGGLAAAGLGVLFNVGFRALSWCAASGALMLAVRTVALGFGWSMEAASFVAALAGGVVVQLLPSPIGVSRNALHILGCIPMLPGGFAAKAILGLFAITAQHPVATNETIITAVDNTLRVMFTVGALGIGLAIPTLVLRVRGMK
ncbi:MAG TPA: threonine/serine exporter family protein [Terriglobales bacterium]|jgi:uncharacterized membrane protein YjjB (DUF3815 family)|nr:threonine/serine exporter family protein [Terriglobales bacterium]